MSFIVSPYNSLRFKEVNDLLPGYNNRLHSEREQVGLIIKPYCQLINSDSTEDRNKVTIQIRTDYDLTVTARIVDNSDNSSAAITVTEKATYTNYSTWEFTYTFNTNGNFTIFINGTDSIQDAVEYESEPIDVETSHKNILRLDYFNETNTEFVDYSTGIRHFVNIVARIPDGEDETDQDVYDNQNKKQKTYSATTFNGEFTTGEIPEYIVRQLILAQGLFFFYVNDIRYTGEELTSERFGSTTSKQVTLICSEFETPGVNSDDSGELPEPIPEGMQNIEFLNLEDVAGNQQLTITQNYLPDTLMFVLKTGTSGTVKVGTTVSGDEVSSPKSLTTANPVYTLDREYLKLLAQYENSFILYFTITGVGVTLDINVVQKKYK